MVPYYSYPPRLMASLLRDLLLVRRRSFHADSEACIRRLKPALQIYGQENIPTSGLCLVTVNHYFRSGFGAWWIPLAVADDLKLMDARIFTDAPMGLELGAPRRPLPVPGEIR